MKHKAVHHFLRRMAACNCPNRTNLAGSKRAVVSARSSWSKCGIHLADPQSWTFGASMHGQQLPPRRKKNTPCRHTGRPCDLQIVFRAIKLFLSSFFCIASKVCFLRRLIWRTLDRKRLMVDQSCATGLVKMAIILPRALSMLFTRHAVVTSKL